MRQGFPQELNKAMSKKEEQLMNRECKSCKLPNKENRKPFGRYVLPFKRFYKELPALFKEDEGNAGFDLFARLDEPVTLEPGEVKTIPLNVATDIPVMAVGLLFQRSSTYRKWKVKLTNGVGVIDATFNGDGDEWGAEFKNESTEPTTINPGDKICQAVFLPLLPVKLHEVDVLGNEDRGGFGTSFDNVSEIE